MNSGHYSTNKPQNLYIVKADSHFGDAMLEDYLMPGEKVVWTGPQVMVGDGMFSVYITDKRLVLYRLKGTLIKKEDFIAEKLSHIQNMKFRQEGLLGKKGTLTIEMPNRKMALKGTADAIKSTYQSLMQFWEEK
jgi:hypothetical protein